MTGYVVMAKPRRWLSRYRRRELLGVGEVLMRGAVAVVRQRHPLARRALARARAALQRIAVDVKSVDRQAAEEIVATPR